MNIKINGMNISYSEIGSGDTVLLVHGWGGSKESLLGIGSKLASHRRVILIDLPGFGESGIPPVTWGVEEYGELVVQFIRRLNIEKSLLYIGHSFGGALGLYLASRKEVEFSGMVVIAPSFYRELKVSSLAKFVNKVIPFYPKIKDYLFPIRKLVYRVLYPSSDSLRHPRIESVFRNIVSKDLRDELDKIDTMLLILWGENDIDTPIKDAYYLNKAVMGSKLVTYKGYSHNLPLRASQMLSEEITDFIKSL